MTVKLGDKTLNTTDAEFTGSELFWQRVENGSAVLPLTISDHKRHSENRSVQRRGESDADSGDYREGGA